MKVKEAMEELRNEVWPKYEPMFNIGFLSSEETEDEVQFDIHGTVGYRMACRELEELFHEFCKENGFQDNSVVYITHAGICDDLD